MSSDDRGDFWTRRRWLKGTAATGIAGVLAGCSGEPEPETGPTDDTGDGTGATPGTDTDAGTPEPVDISFKFPVWYGLANSNFNLFGETYNLWTAGALLYDRLAYMSRKNLVAYPQALESYQVGDGAMTLKLREGLSWHSGQPFTAQDVANHVRLHRLFGPPFTSVEGEKGIEVVDEHTLEWHFASDTNTTMAYFSMLALDFYQIGVHPELHAEFIERERDATTEDARAGIRTDLAAYVISPEDAIETVGNGPVQLTEVNDQELVLEAYPDYPPLSPDSDAESAGTLDEEFRLNFNDMRGLDVGGGNKSSYRAALSDQVDFFDGGAPKAIRNQLGDHWELMDPPTETYTYGFCFGAKGQFGGDAEADRKARQAIAHLYDPRPWVQLMGGKSVAKLVKPNHVTDLTTVQINQWLSDSINDFTHYGLESRTDRAATLLGEAGYERNNNGKWMDSSGQVLDLKIYYDNSQNFGASVRNVAQQFNDFGLTTETHGMAYTPYYNYRMEHELDFGLAYPGGGPHPYYAFHRNLGSLSAPWWYNHERAEYTVPWPVGDPDGTATPINVNERIQELATDVGEERERELVRELSWVFNQWVPMISAQLVLIQRFGDVGDWDYGLPFSDPRTGGYTDTPMGQTLRMKKFHAKPQ